MHAVSSDSTISSINEGIFISTLRALAVDINKLIFFLLFLSQFFQQFYHSPILALRERSYRMFLIPFPLASPVVSSLPQTLTYMVGGQQERSRCHSPKYSTFASFWLGVHFGSYATLQIARRTQLLGIVHL